MAVCPYCEKEIDSKNIVKEKVVLSKSFKLGTDMLSCPSCKKILGFASNY